MDSASWKKKKNLVARKQVVEAKLSELNLSALSDDDIREERTGLLRELARIHTNLAEWHAAAPPRKAPEMMVVEELKRVVFELREIKALLTDEVSLKR